MANIQVASDSWDEEQVTQKIDTLPIEDLKSDFTWIMAQIVGRYGDDQEDHQDAA